MTRRSALPHSNLNSSSVPHSSQTRPLDALAIATVVGLCLCWGFNQVAIKFAIHEIPPIIQAALRSFFGALFVGAWALSRGIPLFKRDGTLLAGIVAGALFALEFLLIARGLVWTTATRATLFLYSAPFLVVIGSRWFIPSDHFHASQWLGLLLSFIGIVIAFGLPTPAADPHQLLGDLMLLGAAVAWAATTLVIKTSALNHASAEKNLLYQLVVSFPLLAVAVPMFGEHIDGDAVSARARHAGVSNRLGGERHLPGLVCAGCALFGYPPVSIHLSDAVVWRGSRPSGTQ